MTQSLPKELEEKLENILDEYSTYYPWKPGEMKQNWYNIATEQAVKQISNLFSTAINLAKIEELKELTGFLKQAHLYDQDSAMKLRYHLNERLKALTEEKK